MLVLTKFNLSLDVECYQSRSLQQRLLDSRKGNWVRQLWECVKDSKDKGWENVCPKKDKHCIG